MNIVINDASAVKLAEAYMQFLQTKNSIFSEKDLSYVLSDAIIKKSDGYIFEVLHEQSKSLPKFICVVNDWRVFSPTLVPALARKQVEDEEQVRNLAPYADKPLNTGSL